MQAEQYKMAFSCFKLAADQNYSKAQYNVGLCYEHGRGTTKDMTKVFQSHLFYSAYVTALCRKLSERESFIKCLLCPGT